LGRVDIHPAVFVRVARQDGQANKGLTRYGTWRSAQRIENKGFTKRLFARKRALRGEGVQVIV
jgi:hypothetical protein